MADRSIESAELRGSESNKSDRLNSVPDSKDLDNALFQEIMSSTTPTPIQGRALLNYNASNFLMKRFDSLQNYAGDELTRNELVPGSKKSKTDNLNEHILANFDTIRDFNKSADSNATTDRLNFTGAKGDKLGISIDERDAKFYKDLSYQTLMDSYLHEKASTLLADNFHDIDWDHNGAVSGEELTDAIIYGNFNPAERNLLFYLRTRADGDYSRPDKGSLKSPEYKARYAEITFEEADTMTVAERISKTQAAIFGQNYTRENEIVGKFVGGAVGSVTEKFLEYKLRKLPVATEIPEIAADFIKSTGKVIGADADYEMGINYYQLKQKARLQKMF